MARGRVLIMKFVVYSKDGCPYCDKVKNVLTLTKMDFVSYSLGHDFTKNQFYEKFGEGSTFPQVVVDETHIGGCTDTVKFLRENKIV